MSAIVVSGNIGINGFGLNSQEISGDMLVNLNTYTPGYYAKNVTIWNNGTSGTIFAKVNCSESQWNNGLSANAVPIPINSTFVFDGDGAPPIFSVFLSSPEVSATTFSLGAF